MHYNLFRMALSSQVMFLLLFLSALGMALIAAFYLRRRNLSLPQYLVLGHAPRFIPFPGTLPGRPFWDRDAPPEAASHHGAFAMKSDRFLWILLIGVCLLVVAGLLRPLLPAP